jgi:hypothetical protein
MPGSVEVGVPGQAAAASIDIKGSLEELEAGLFFFRYDWLLAVFFPCGRGRALQTLFE